MPSFTARPMYADGPLIVGGVFAYQLRAAEPAEAQVSVRCVVERDGYHAHFYKRPRFGDAQAVEVIHDFMSWDPEETVPCAPIIVGRRITSPTARRSAYASVEAAFAALLPGVPVPPIECKGA